MSNKLENCCKFQEGYVNPPQNNANYFGGSIKWLRSTDLNDGFVYNTSRHLTKAGFLSAGKSAVLFKKDTIAISKSGTIGTLGILKDEMCGNRAVINIDVCSDKADMRYIFYLLKYNKSALIKKANGSIQKNLYVSILSQVDVPHTLDMQRNISKVLSSIDDKIELNNKINEELENMAKTLYDYWFVQFDFPDEKGRPYKSANGKMVYNEVLKREIPLGWEVIKFDDLVEQAPKLKAIKAPDYKNQGDIPIVDQASTLITGRTDDMSYYYKNERNCVVFGDVTTCFKYINFPFAKGTDGTKIINAKDDRIPAILLYQLLKDTKLPNIGFARHYMFLREINLLLPPKNICNDYYGATKGIMDLRAKNIEENYKLSVTRDFLLPLLMNGQVSVQN